MSECLGFCSPETSIAAVKREPIEYSDEKPTTIIKKQKREPIKVEYEESFAALPDVSSRSVGQNYI